MRTLTRAFLCALIGMLVAFIGMPVISVDAQVSCIVVREHGLTEPRCLDLSTPEGLWEYHVQALMDERGIGRLEAHWLVYSHVLRVTVFDAWPHDDNWADRIIQCESRWNPNAVGRYREAGLWQIHKGSWQRYVVANYGSWDRIFDPVVNTEVAAHIFRIQGPRAWTCNRRGY